MSNENSGNVLPSDYCGHLFDFAKLAKIYKFRFANSWFDSPMATWRTLTGTLIPNSSVGTSTYFLYLSKSTSNRRKSYSSRSNSTHKKMYLKYKYKVNKCTVFDLISEHALISEHPLFY